MKLGTLTPPSGTLLLFKMYGVRPAAVHCPVGEIFPQSLYTDTPLQSASRYLHFIFITTVTTNHATWDTCKLFQPVSCVQTCSNSFQTVYRMHHFSLHRIERIMGSWDMTPCSMTDTYQCFAGMYWLHVQGWRPLLHKMDMLHSCITTHIHGVMS